MDKLIPVVAIVGPTASGKTKLGVDLALEFNGEVISADSMQIYKGLDIAVAKPTEEEMQGVKHHLIDFQPISEPYSVAQYVTAASDVICDIRSRNKTPIIVGGTGLYVDSLINEISFSDEPKKSELREQLVKEAEDIGKVAMHEKLAQIDPDYAATLHPNNLGRVIRAIEFFHHTGKTMSEQLEESRRITPVYNPFYIGTNYRSRDLLYNRINLRVDEMINSGLLDEARWFYSVYKGKTSAQAIGYKELFPFINNNADINDCIETLKMQTRRYAKRQITWFNKNKAVNWLCHDDFENYDTLLYAAKKMVSRFISKDD